MTKKKANQIIPIHNLKRGDSLSVPLRLVRMSSFDQGNYDFSRPHRHNYYEIFLFQFGGGEHEVDFTTHKISSPSIHVVTPGRVHKIKRNSESNGFVLLFTEEFALQASGSNESVGVRLRNATLQSPVIQLTSEEKLRFRSMIDDIESELSSSDPYSEQALQALVSTLAIAILRESERVATKSSAASSERRLCNEYLKLIEITFNTLHAVTDYSERLNVSSKHLSECVKNVTGSNALCLIQDRIVLEAKRLLAHSDSSVKEIAFALGYDDPSYFTRFFREKNGATPREFRQSFANSSRPSP